MNDTTYAKGYELECKDDCGLNNMKQEIVDMCNAVRLICGFALHFNSGCRCEIHNKNEGGKKSSSHKDGEAVDISCTDDTKRFILIAALQAVGFKRILVYKTFIHVDISKTKKRIILKLMF